MADIMNSAGFSGFADTAAAGQGVPPPQQPSTTSSGTPLMNLITYLLFFQCSLILLLTLPIYVPYRKEAMEFLHYSPSLWKFRVVLFSITGFLTILTVDTYLRLDRLNFQITGMQTAQANAVAGHAGMAAAAGAAAPASSSSNMNELFGSRFRAQRDFYLLSFNLFASLVLFQMHLLLMRLDRYKNQRNEARARADISNKTRAVNAKDQPTIGQSLSDTAASVGQSISATVDSITNKVAPSRAANDEVLATKKTNNINGTANQRQVFVAEE